MNDLVDIARKRPDRITTHWEGCEEQHTECLIARMADEIERLRELVNACSIYLKDDETPAQRIERERSDTDSVLKILLKEKRENGRLRGLLRYWLEGGTDGADTLEDRVREALGDD